MARNKPEQGINKNLIIICIALLALIAAIIAYGYTASQKNKEMAEKAALIEAQKQAQQIADEAQKQNREAEFKARIERQAQQWGKPTPWELAQEASKKRDNERRSMPLAIGMSTSDARNSFSWGRPEHINTTTTARGQSEQWVYSRNRYLYFTNGVLTAIQN